MTMTKSKDSTFRRTASSTTLKVCVFLFYQSRIFWVTIAYLYSKIIPGVLRKQLCHIVPLVALFYSVNTVGCNKKLG